MSTNSKSIKKINLNLKHRRAQSAKAVKKSMLRAANRITQEVRVERALLPRLVPNSQRKKNRVRVPRAEREGDYLKGAKGDYQYENKDTVVQHYGMREEVVGPILGSGPGVVLTNYDFNINPGNMALFPIFSTVASTYEEWKLNHLSFHIRTEAFNATTTGLSAGKLVQVTQYNPSNPSFTDTRDGLRRAENYDHAAWTVPFKNMAHRVQPEGMATRGRTMKGYNANKTYLVNISNNGTIPEGSAASINDYLVGKYQLMAANNAVTSEVGELIVKYSFTMIKPKQPDNLHGAVGHYTGVPTSSNVFAGLTPRPGSSPFLTVTNPSNGKLTIVSSHVGYPILLTMYINSSASNYPTTPVYTTGTTALDNLLGDTTNTVGLASGAAALFVFSAQTVTNYWEVTWTSGSIGTGATFDLFISLLPDTLVGRHQVISQPAFTMQERLMQLAAKEHEAVERYRHTDEFSEMKSEQD